MKLVIHTIQFDAERALLDFLQKKVDKLEKFYDKFVDGEVFLKVEKGDRGRENKVVEIKLSIPGGSLFAKEVAASFEVGIDEAVESLRRQIRKHKDKVAAR